MTGAEISLRFGPFVLQPARKLLLEGGDPVRVGSRALDLLIVLAVRAGEIVARDELVAAVWPTTIVEETSLRVHVSALRRVLREGQAGGRYIDNVPGRGYRFVAPVERMLHGAPAPLLAPSRVPTAGHNLPSRATRVIGRADSTASLRTRLSAHRLVSIIGPGGMGKTTVAIALAEGVVAQYAHGVRFVDFSPLADARLLAASVLQAVDAGNTVARDDPRAGLCTVLADRHMLLVLDNCEHVVEAAASLAEAILRAAPRVQILATSREPLRADGECIYLLAALGLPDPLGPPLLAQVGRSPAVELFVERAMAHAEGFQLTEANMAAVLGICRQLDGIPLAIELAASRVDGLGVDELAARLDDRFGLFTRGRRLARARHRTLRAMMDWSHDLLGHAERVVFRRMSILRTSFSLEAATAVAAFGDLGEGDVVDGLLSLVSKSLVTTDNSAHGVLYRLLYSTRAYAEEKLHDSGDRDLVAVRHAEYLQALLVRSVGRELALSFSERVAFHARIADDICHAMAWAVTEGRHVALGVRLAVGALHASHDSGSSIDAYGRYLDEALQKLARLESPDPELELHGLGVLCHVSGQSRALQRSPADIVARTLALSALCQSTDEHIAALYGATGASFGNGRFRDAQRVLQRLRGLCQGAFAPLSVVVADRMSALVAHYLGEHTLALQLSERVLRCSLDGVQRRFIPEVPLGVSQGILRARILWLRGLADQAAEAAGEALEQAVVNGVEHAMSACQALAMAVVPVALWRGDLERAGEALRRLHDLAHRTPLSYWMSWSRNFEAALAVRRGGDVPGGLPWSQPLNAMEADHLATFAEPFLGPQGIERVGNAEVGWCAPEVLRVQGERRLLDDDDEALADGEALLQRALQLAREQQALAWELRSATSLGRLWWEQGLAGQARELVAGTLARCTEGLDTADPVRARALLDAMQAADACEPADDGAAPQGLAMPGAGDAALPPEITFHGAFSPRSTSLVFGRDDAIAEVGAQLAARRLVTIVGAGGMGKTTVALAVAHRLAADYPDGIVYVELAPLGETARLAATLAASLGIPVGGGVQSQVLQDRLRAALHGKRLLVVLDSCENVVAAAAELAEMLLAGTQHLHVLATSREPLLAAGEGVHRLAPIALPASGAGLSVDEALAYPGIALFVARARTVDPIFSLQPAQVEDVVALCLRLDGIPLAIELAAAAVGQVDIGALTAQVEDRLFRTDGVEGGAPARHRTLRAMLDWSYERLAAAEQQALQRLAVFRGAFTLESAAAMLADGADGAATECVLGLVTKSLVSIANAQGDGRFRLLDTTRTYALHKLECGTMATDARRRHAEHVRVALARAEQDWERMTVAQWRTAHAAWIDEVRAALDWAFSDAGDAELGVKLAVDAFPLADQTSLLADFGAQVDRAMQVVASLPEPLPWHEMRLKADLGRVYQRRAGAEPEVQSQLESALAVARTTGSAKYQMAALIGLWSAAFQHANYPLALAWSSRMAGVAQQYSDPYAQLTSERTRAQTLHFLGEHDEAQALALRVIDNAWQRIPLGYTPSPVDMRVSMRIVLARIQWMQGMASQARAQALACVDAAAQDSPTSLCHALALAAIPITLWDGDAALGRECVARLKHHARHYGFGYWADWSLRYEAVLAVMAGDDPVQHAGALASEGPHVDKQSDHLSTFGARLWRPGALARVRAGAVGWCAPEVIRARGERLLADDPVGAASRASAEAFFIEAVAIARRQRAVAWELRASTSLARLMAQDGRDRMAAAMLARLAERCAGGDASPDCAAAMLLQQQLLSRAGA